MEHRALDTAAFTEPVREILSKYAGLVLPLTRTGNCNAEDAAKLQQMGPQSLFPGARAAEAAASGLLLLLGCWDQSHKLSQEVPSREGSYWHAIAHRMEPDASNSGYWFRQVGEHAIFPALHRNAAEILERRDTPGWRLKPVWDPFLFIEWCEEARRKPGTEEARAALEIQGAEWDLLFDWCASDAGRKT
jgi:hypothetical protein